jgi:hypothetical protein
MEINLTTEGGRARTVRKAKRAARRTLSWIQIKAERAGPWAIVLVMLLLAPLACVLVLQRKHGSVMGSASRFRQLELSAAETAAAMQAHTMLMLGGPHRGGTTLLWRLLGQHPNVSAFSRDPLQEALTPFLPGGRLAADVDVGMEMEGLYQQSVYPLFGLGSQVRSFRIHRTHAQGWGSCRLTADRPRRVVRRYTRAWVCSKATLLSLSAHPPTGAQANSAMCTDAESARAGANAQAGVSGYSPQAPRKDGFGRFAMLPEAHLTEKSRLVTYENRLRLFREWGTHWDLSRPVLMEKSPPNMMWMRFLQVRAPPLLTPMACEPGARCVGDNAIYVNPQHSVEIGALQTRGWERAHVSSRSVQ